MKVESSSYNLDYVLFIIALLIIISILYFYLRKPVQKKNEQSIPSPSSKKPDTKTVLQTQAIAESSKESPKTTAKILHSQKTTRPYTTHEPFEETPGIAIDDFLTFKGTHLLIVEDNKINQNILLSVLKRSGMEITVANHGEEALEYLQTPGKEFDLVLMDISMPVMDGYTTTQKIREDERFDTLPIITLTAFAIGKEIRKMFELGANGYLTKPLNNKQLYTVFQTYLGHLKRPVSEISSLKMKGLDVEHGIAQSEGDEKVYRQKLREFISLYGSWGKEMPIWIEHNDYDLIKLNLIKIAAKLGPLGAYELEELVGRMKKTFIYGTEHRINEFKDLFSEKLKRLIIAMRLYLQEELH